MNGSETTSGAELLRAARAIAPELVNIRRDIHRYPELGFDQTRTAETITRRLDALGIAPVRAVAGTGVVALIEGCAAGPVVGLRADMDALPIEEKTGAAYASRIPGVMHACGHDAHVACLLGAAELLARRRNRFAGGIQLIFQPAEEIDRGADAVISDGALENPSLDAIFGLHVDPDVPTGKILLKKGPWMGAIDTFRIQIAGRGGHGAYPHQSVDAVVAGAAVVMNLQTVVSRRTDPLLPLVVSVGTFNAGRADNIVAATAQLSGTMRCIDPQLHQQAPVWFKAVVANTAKALGAESVIDYQRVVPPLVNHPAMTETVVQAAAAVLGENATMEDACRMGGDDFSRYLEIVPGAYFHLGAGDETAAHRPALHTDRFDIDERCLPLGAALLVQTALSLLPPGGGPDVGTAS